jgi:FtsH-binding integral membrane protein
MFAPLVMVMVMGFGIHVCRPARCRLLWASPTVMGVSMSVIPLVYSGGSIATTFFATAAAFVSLSLYGYTTKRGPVGVRHVPDHGRGRPVRAMIANMFIQSARSAW